MKVASKISIVFFVTVLLLAGSVLPFAYITQKRDLEEAIFNHLSATLRSRVLHVETFLDLQKRATVQLSQSMVLRNLLSADEKDAAYPHKLDIAVKRLQHTKGACKYLYEVFILNANGSIAASSNRDEIGLDRSGDAYFLGAKAGPYIKDVYFLKTMQKGAIAISAPITASKTGKFLGVVVSRLNLDMLNRIAADRTGLGETGEIYILNEDGYMITPSRFMEDTFLTVRGGARFTEEKLNVTEEHGDERHEHHEHHEHLGYPGPHEHSVRFGCKPLVYINYRGVKVLGVHAHISEMPWVLVAEIDEKEALAPLGRLRWIFILITLFISALGLLMGRFISEIIAKPIRKLFEGTEIVGKGDLDHKVGTSAKDEIGQFSRAFDIMTDNLKKTTTSVHNLNREIERRRKIQQKLQETTEQLKAILDGSPDLIMQLDTDMNILWANKAAIRRNPDAVGQPCYKAFKGRVDPCPSCPAKRSIDTGHIEKEVLPPESTDAATEEWWEDIGVPIKEDDGSIRSVIWIGRDVTETKKAEKELQSAYHDLKETQKQLIQSAKMGAVGMLAGGVAHEVKNPLGIIMQCINYLEKATGADKKKQSEILSIGRKAVIRADKIVHGLLNFSKPAPLELKPCGMEDVLQTSLELVGQQLKLKGVKIIQDFAPGLPLVMIDENQIRQVFLNIFLNALQAMPEGGELTTRIYTRKLTETKDLIGSKEEDFMKIGDRILVCEIENTGSGISEDKLSKVFDPFFTTREPGEGTGLGLTITRSIVERHNGVIEMESKEDR
ncbi:MAG: PAS domain-containing protein [Candidatus Omnitrophica bacterium]|nr:PAS domain-containing protein [Candidatus Omnitrophota bacterium]